MILTGPLKLLYVTPERLAKSKHFMNALRTCYIENKLNMIAIDEVHCISELGHTFRPDYKKLTSLKTLFPNTPILGVTATATNDIIRDIQRTLNIQDCLVVKAPITRPNFYYHVSIRDGLRNQCYSSRSVVEKHIFYPRIRNKHLQSPHFPVYAKI